jgi:carbon starvation protein
VMGFYMFRWRPGSVREATIVGVTVMFLAVVFGKNVAESSIGHWFVLSHHQVTIAMALYTIAAATLPVWMLLTPRAYLSTFMKIGTIAFLVVGVMVLNPELKAPAFSQYIGGGGPIIPGPLFPFVFITIACGAISGFHALVSTGTTSKMIDKESDIRPIGYGAMLIEGVVGIVAIITASALQPGDYYAINTTPEVFKSLGMAVVNLPELQREVGEIVTGRPGGAVSLAVGMAQIFSGLPGMRSLMAYWYHFAIMFEAVFILTTIDSGTRIGRFILQEFVGRAWKPFARTDWLPGSLISTGVMVLSWAYFIWTGNISTVWPLFGVANQLLAVVAFAVGTTLIINIGRAKYAWITFLPLCFIATTTLTAGYLNIRDNYWPMAIGANPALQTQGYVNSICTGIMMGCAVIILVATSHRSLSVLTGRMRQLTLTEAEV